MDRRTQIEFFVQAAELGSMSKAAEKLRVVRDDAHRAWTTGTPLQEHTTDATGASPFVERTNTHRQASTSDVESRMKNL
jgi:hypothetical protein